jgi:hypothetical protein
MEDIRNDKTWNKLSDTQKRDALCKYIQKELSDGDVEDVAKNLADFTHDIDTAGSGLAKPFIKWLKNFR